MLAVGVVELDEVDKYSESSSWGIGGKDLMRLWYSSSSKYSSYSGDSPKKWSLRRIKGCTDQLFKVILQILPPVRDLEA